jgi:2-oxoglutarate dehydrogenase E1 component
MANGQIGNIALIEELYQRYNEDPSSVDISWQRFFDGMEFASVLNRNVEPAADETLRIRDLIDQFRRFGHLEVQVNCIAEAPPPPAEELSLKALGFRDADLDRTFPSCGFTPNPTATLRELTNALRNIYCSRIGFEFMHINDPSIVEWFQKRLEPFLQIDLPIEKKQFLLELLHKAELFEVFIHTKYVGQKRFSIEGAETLIPMLAEMIEMGAEGGMDGFVMGMAHRGRLNVLTNILQKPYSVIFQEFEDVLPKIPEGNGDVKYHKGFSARVKTKAGPSMDLHLSANSSCLESVDPIVLGRTRGNQVVSADQARKKTGSILIHGDAALAGQGVIYEIMQFMSLPGYGTGGTIHIAVNNQIGFTTLPEDGRSTRYCTDIALSFGCPVLHVNAEDPESCFFAAKIAVEFRLQFGRDVFIDLNCYRKYGHNEGDEPAFTQPGAYSLIRAKKTIRELYLEKLVALGVMEPNVADTWDVAFRQTLDAALQRGKGEEPHLPTERYGIHWKEAPAEKTLFEPFDSSAKESVLRQALDGYCKIPAGFHLHPKLQKWVEERKASLQGKIDWGTAECLAFGSLLLQKVPVRLSGQDSERGTFSQRHAMWVDQETNQKYGPYSVLGSELGGSLFTVYNSPLSEYAVLGFEYGYTESNLNALVLWEAQYGDFSIGAQIITDHYVASAEQKWARYSSLVLLLPHGYEGQGPEHSSGRIERFLQLCGVNNMQIVNATTPAQYFHVLRRQALRPIKKPLIIFTPKSILRLPACSSKLSDFTAGGFEEVLKDPSPPQKIERVLLCSGKVFYDLLVQREARKRAGVAIFRIEQLYPIHEEKLRALLQSAGSCKDFRWVQEEPENMGAWEFIQPHLDELLPKEATLRYVGRARSAVTATGSFRQHKVELDHFMNEAFE